MIGISPEITKVATTLSLIYVVLLMFCAVGYSVRDEDSKT